MTSGFAIANGIAQFASGFLMDRYVRTAVSVVIGIGTYAAAEPAHRDRANGHRADRLPRRRGIRRGINMVATRL